MIQITRDGSKIVITVRGQHPVASTDFIATCNLNDENYAKLATDNLQRHLWATLTVIRERAYEQGWKDAKAHRRKANWFSGTIHNTNSQHTIP
jgi:hypothetical protein